MLLVDGLDNWELVLGLGLLASLMNDLFYQPAAVLLFAARPDLASFYRFQLGLGTGGWAFRGGPLAFTVTSPIMAASIYARLAAIVLVEERWWRTPSYR